MVDWPFNRTKGEYSNDDPRNAKYQQARISGVPISSSELDGELNYIRDGLNALKSISDNLQVAGISGTDEPENAGLLLTTNGNEVQWTQVLTNQITNNNVTFEKIQQGTYGALLAYNQDLTVSELLPSANQDYILTSQGLNNLPVYKSLSSLVVGADSAVNANKAWITDGAGNLSFSYITNNQIEDNAITGAKITDATITTAKIVDANITNAKLADDSVTTSKIVDANITNAKLADNSVTTAKIVDANITNAKVANNSITIDKLRSQGRVGFVVLNNADYYYKDLLYGGLNDWKIPTKITGSGEITLQGLKSFWEQSTEKFTGSQITDATITTTKIADNNVTNAKLADGISASKLTSGQRQIFASNDDGGFTPITLTYTNNTVLCGKSTPPYAEFRALTQNDLPQIGMQPVYMATWYDNTVLKVYNPFGYVTSFLYYSRYGQAMRITFNQLALNFVVQAQRYNSDIPINIYTTDSQSNTNQLVIQNTNTNGNIIIYKPS